VWVAGTGDTGGASARAQRPRTVGSNGAASARPIRNGLLIALKAVDPHAAPARSEASEAIPIAAAAEPPRFTWTFDPLT
jgi:hypothetical protein